MKALQSKTTRSILVSVRNTFGNAYYTFFNPPAATDQTLTLPLSNNVFPFSNLGSVTINSITFYIVLPSAYSGSGINANFFNPTGAKSSVSFPLSAAGQSAAGVTIDALTGSVSPVGVPQSLTVTVSAGTFVPTAVEDILLVIDYSIN